MRWILAMTVTAGALGLPAAGAVAGCVEDWEGKGEVALSGEIRDAGVEDGTWWIETEHFLPDQCLVSEVWGFDSLPVDCRPGGTFRVEDGDFVYNTDSDIQYTLWLIGELVIVTDEVICE